MINYQRYILPNGLTVILQEDKSSSLIAVNLLYKVGSKNEHPEHTGFAHLFEHMMFTGSKNVPDFDIPIQMSGGENNAFTNVDITNYYDLVPAENIETALWVEADRMQNLLLNQEKLDIQKKVVVEEFYETCLNQPYGDIWHHVSEISYEQHNYRWPTIGLVPEHIKKITLEESKHFYRKYYQPSNAVLALSGNFEEGHVKELIGKYFGDIENEQYPRKNKIASVENKKGVTKVVQADVPLKAFYITYPMPDRSHKDFYTMDLISDIFSYGRSSRFYVNLFQKKNLFTHIESYISGTVDPGLFVIESKLQNDVSFDQAKKSIQLEIDKIIAVSMEEKELQKIKNKIISNLHFSQVSVANKAMNLAYYESVGNANLINEESEIYEAVTVQDVKRCCQELFDPLKANYLHYG